MTRKSWKLSDTVAAVFFGIWISSILFRPFFGGLDIIILIVSAVWAASLWARKQLEEPPVPLAKEQEEHFQDLEIRKRKWRNNPAYSFHPNNVFHKSDD